MKRDAVDGPARGMGTGQGFCTGCGVASCAGCDRPFDPPRFCSSCGRRLTVAVTPGGYRARCRDHGELSRS
ncbi:MAG TPA: hypothetical protein VG054_09795 [Acidimicrobiales bacterium]|nr:hypothetical protein [Acidimicrobiales bacterium]